MKTEAPIVGRSTMMYRRNYLPDQINFLQLDLLYLASKKKDIWATVAISTTDREETRKLHFGKNFNSKWKRSRINHLIHRVAGYARTTQLENVHVEFAVK
jgi:hypothetical protein